MTDILLCSLIVSLFCLGLKISTGEDMLLNFIKLRLDRVFVKDDDSDLPYYSKLYYPILYCIKCMPSIYGTAISFLLLPFGVELLYQIPLVVFCSVTLNCVIYQMYE